MPEALAAACAGGCIVVLAVAAYWDPTIRVLHTAEALPYVIAATLCLGRRTVGYALALASGGVWLWAGAFEPHSFGTDSRERRSFCAAGGWTVPTS